MMRSPRTIRFAGSKSFIAFVDLAKSGQRRRGRRALHGEARADVHAALKR
jgi:hypothetical protein